MTNSLASVRQFRREHHPSGALLHNRDAGGLAAGIELEAVAGNVTALPIFENDRERVATKHRCPPLRNNSLARASWQGSSGCLVLSRTKTIGSFCPLPGAPPKRPVRWASPMRVELVMPARCLPYPSRAF